jgi:hypothetical protein
MERPTTAGHLAASAAATVRVYAASMRPVCGQYAAKAADQFVQ